MLFVNILVVTGFGGFDVAYLLSLRFVQQKKGADKQFKLTLCSCQPIHTTKCVSMTLPIVGVWISLFCMLWAYLILKKLIGPTFFGVISA